MTKTIKITNGVTLSEITEILKRNLFTLAEDAWVYLDDSGQVMVSIAYRTEGTDTMLDIYFTNTDMEILIEKIFNEIKADN